MEQFRKSVRGPVGKILIFLFAVPFVISGFYGYFSSSGGGNHVAEVEGTKISKQALQEQLQRLRQNMLRQNPQLDPSLVDSFVNPSMTLGSMINGILLEKEAEESNVIVSEQQAAQRIRNNPNFTKDGEFSEAVYEQVLRQVGLNPRTFLSQIRVEMASNQLRAGFEETDFVLPNELQRRQALAGQTRELQYARASVAELRKQYEVSEEEIQAYYQDHQQDFMNPAKYRLEYLKLTADHYADMVEVTEDDLQAEYQARIQIIQSLAEDQNKRKVAHILFKTGDKRSEEEARALAMDAAIALSKGADFAELAKQQSDDLATRNQGGQLGVVEKGVLPEELETVLFSMKEGTVSDPVSSDSGIHLLKLIEIEETEVPSFEEMKPSLVTELKAGKQEALLAEELITLEDLAYEQPDLVVAADELDLELKRTDWFELGALPETLQSEAVRQTLADPSFMDSGANSQLLEVGANQYMVLRVADIMEPSPVALEEVRPNIERLLARSKAQDALDEQEAQLRDALAEGADLQQLASGMQQQVASEVVTRNQSEPSIELVRAAFEVARAEIPSSVQVVRLADGDLVAMQVVAVQDGSVTDAGSREMKMALAGAARQEGRRSLSQVIGWLKASKDVEVFEDRLQDEEDEEAL